MITLSQLALLSNRSYQTVRSDVHNGVIFPVIRARDVGKRHADLTTMMVDERVARKYILLVEKGKMQRPKELPCPRRYAIMRMRSEGICDKDIAKIMGISVQGVRMSVYYGKKLKDKTKELHKIGGGVNVVPNSELATSTQHKHPVRMAES